MIGFERKYTNSYARWQLLLIISSSSDIKYFFLKVQSRLTEHRAYMFNLRYAIVFNISMFPTIFEN